jgi:dihydroxyacetone kinase
VKKVINEPVNVVIEMCEGLVIAYPDIISLNKKYRIVMRKNLNPDKSQP